MHVTSVGSYTAKTHLPQLLKRASNGEKIIITIRGKPVAMLTPPPRKSAGEIRSVIAQMEKLRKGNTLGKGVTLRDLIEEGRRY